MNARSLRSEVKRLAALVGADEEPVHLVTLTVVDASAGQMDFPDDTGHVLSYRVQGRPASFFFPFSAMSSAQAEELALAIVQHARKTERLGRRSPAGLLDMTFPSPGAVTAEQLPAGVSIPDYAAALYQQAIEARHEYTQAH
ncbi:hypothetical protein ACYU03_04465 [Pseudomonas sp. X10]